MKLYIWENIDNLNSVAFALAEDEASARQAILDISRTVTAADLEHDPIVFPTDATEPLPFVYHRDGLQPVISDN